MSVLAVQGAKPWVLSGAVRGEAQLLLAGACLSASAVLLWVGRRRPPLGVIGSGEHPLSSQLAASVPCIDQILMRRFFPFWCAVGEFQSDT